MPRNKKWAQDIKFHHMVWKTLMRPGYRTDGHWMSDELIEEAKTKALYSSKTPHHENNDCIRAAYEWFNAQQLLKGPKKHKWDFDLLIEAWSRLPISISDIEVVAALHPELRTLGGYPNYNISPRLVEPSLDRLLEIPPIGGFIPRIEHEAAFYVLDERHGWIRKRPKRFFQYYKDFVGLDRYLHSTFIPIRRR